MRYKIKIKSKLPLAILLFASLLVAFTVEGDRGKKLSKSSEVVGDSYYYNINNLAIPISSDGIIADVAIPGNLAGGRLDSKIFLYSGGFFLSGKTNNNLWTNAQASASRIQDYRPGTYESGPNDSRAQIYILKSIDGDFAPSWEEWADAVALGAYYYDGNANGVYDPSDLNGNGKWDAESFPGAGDGEDRPDLLGDQTAWTVYHDGLSSALRTFNDVEPQGIEIRQSVFGFQSKGITGNMVFIRYSILNTGRVADEIDSCYFTLWADPDLGEANEAYFDDMVGCDTTINAGFIYNDADDPDWGVEAPCFLIDFFQGPISYVPGETFVDANGNGSYDEGEVALDTAYNVQGQVRGIQTLPGARNEGLSSFIHYLQGREDIGDPDTKVEARRYQTGLNRLGEELDPCTWIYGNVLGGVNCAQVDNRYWYSGDPVTSTGWITNFPFDQRQMSNTGPFKLVKDQPVDIVGAYVVGRGENALNSITVAKEYDLIAQLLFDSNFPSPPPPPPIQYEVKTGPDFIDLSWGTSDHVPYRIVDTVLTIDRRFEGYYVTAFRTNSKAGVVSGVNNSEVVAVYDVDNFINDIYQIAPNGGQNLIQEEGIKLDSVLYADPQTGRIRLRIESDPFTDEPLTKGHEYYFAITHYYLNHTAIFNRDSLIKLDSLWYGPVGDYYDPYGGSLEEFDTPLITVTFGEDIYSPAARSQSGDQVSGGSDGDVKYLVVNAEQLTGNEYSVDFFVDESAEPDDLYEPFWKLTNNTTGEVLIDSSKIYNFDTASYAGRALEGIILKVKPVIPEIVTDHNDVEYTGTRWYTNFRTDSSTGVYYVGQDIPQASGLVVGQSGSLGSRSSVISASNLRKIEIRFGENGKAYRYLNGYKGGPFTANRSYVYAAAIEASDTGRVGTQERGIVGKFGEGYVDVPFTVWVNDEKFNEQRQLAVGFIEYSKNNGGNADGIWDPGTLSPLIGNEPIIIFNSNYNPNGGELQYTGNANAWADPITSFELNDPNATPQQIETAASKWFDALYVVGLRKRSANSFYTSGDKLTIPVITYPYTNLDKFTFKTRLGGELSEAEQKALFDKVNVFPNPLFGYNPATSYTQNTAAPRGADEPFVSFSNLPELVTIKIFTLSGTLIRTLTESDKLSITSPLLMWDLKNEDGLRAASGLYLAIVSAQGFGEKILKFSIILPQKQINQF